ncbi:MAG: hypothetical protein H7Y37_06855 [Anaerolineae bacterium]|nr:hypothetical protein [Gloeobacterales cyanobacterium ES-bin-313]
MLSYHFVDQLIHFAGVPPGQDVMGNISHFWKDLTTTGKLSAGIVGFVLGFLLRGITR